MEILLFSPIPLLVCSSALVSVAAPSQQIAQVVAQTSINRPTLTPGSQGEFVSELQAALKLLGFYTGTVDGVYHETTAKAVSQFQQAAGLSANGIVDATTWQKLFPGEAIASSSPTPSSFPVPSQTENNFTPVLTQIGNNSPINATPPEPTLTTPPRQATPANSQNKPVTRSSSVRTQKIPAVQYTSQGLPILRFGMRGSEVAKLQQRLRKLGYFRINADGNFGKETEIAVKDLQSRYDLKPDGVVGGATWELLLQQR
ncbi:MAG: peptidoglycan-binding protein [Fischerella sp.]|nr:peptidoglycan-binding protein [Fischerella sp.]